MGKLWKYLGIISTIIWMVSELSKNVNHKIWLIPALILLFILMYYIFDIGKKYNENKFNI